MYAWIWRKLPFGLWGKMIGSLGLVVATGALLWYVVFPWATPLLPFDDVQVGSGTEQGPAQEDPNVISSTNEDGPDEIPYSTESNAPHPSGSPSKASPTKTKVVLPGD
jgi:cytoskeletal protein RodZ